MNKQKPTTASSEVTVPQLPFLDTTNPCVGSAIKTLPNADHDLLNKHEARRLTDRIRKAVNDVGALIEQAHDRGAWKALGYATWEAYVKTEFGFTRQRSYQLLDQGRVAKAISEATGELSNAFDISKRDADALKSDLDAVTAEIRERVALGQEPVEAVSKSVAAARAKANGPPRSRQLPASKSAPDTQEMTARLLSAWDLANAQARASFMRIARLSAVPAATFYATASGRDA